MYKRIIPILIFYFLIIFLVFTYFLFPLESLKNKIEYTFSKNFTGHLFIKDISLGFPLHLLMKKLQIVIKFQDESKKPEIIYIDEIRIIPNPLKLFTGKAWIHTRVSAANGILNAQLGRKFIGSPRNYIITDMNNLSLNELAFLEEKTGMHITGILNGQTEINFPGNDIIKSEGIWSFNIEKGRIIPPHFPPFTYDSFLGKGFIKEEKIHIENLKLEGQELSLEAKGEVKIARNINNFYVDTKVRLKLLPKFEKKLGFISNFLPKSDNEGYINVPIYGTPNALKFSSK